MYQKLLIEPFVSIQRRRKPIGLNVELENLSLTRKVQAALYGDAYRHVDSSSLSDEQLVRLWGRGRKVDLH